MKQNLSCRHICAALLLAWHSLLPLSAADGIDTFVNSPGLSAASVGYCLIDAATGRTLEAYDELRAMIPASVLKTVTTAAALELLGPDHTFATEVGYTGRIGADGILHGDVVIKGGGDPTLGSEFGKHPKEAFLNRLLAAVRDAGIRKIEGRVLCDDSLFDTEGVSPKWLWEDMGNYFAAGSYALNYADNMYRLTFSSGAAGTTPDILETVPPIPELHFVNYLKAAAASTDSVYIYGAPFSPQRYLYGTLPAHRRSFTVKGDIPDPPLYVGQAVTETLVSGGIPVSGTPVTLRRLREAGDNTEYPSVQKLFTFASDPVIDIVAQTNKRSNNLFAETLLRQIALTSSSVATAARGLDRLRQYWKKRGVDTASMMICDGSGLSPANAISARTLADILLKAYESPHGEQFVHTLPRVGKEGTVKNWLAGSSLPGQLYLKSGSMSRVQCFAGYYIGKKPCVVVLMINNYTCSRSELKKRIEQLLPALLSGK